MEHKHDNNATFFKSYLPLVVVLIFCGWLSFLQVKPFDGHKFMNSFMGYFFIFLAMFKFFDLKGFVEGFTTYDIITKKIPAYGYAYPFVEFFLGSAYLMQADYFLVNLLTLIVMLISGAGVLQSILNGQKIKCACLGTILNVPLSTVSILENFGMGAMAAYNLVTGS